MERNVLSPIIGRKSVSDAPILSYGKEHKSEAARTDAQSNGAFVRTTTRKAKGVKHCSPIII